MKPYWKKIVGWFIAGLTFGIISVGFSGLMAGGITLLISIALLICIFGAPIHIFLTRYRKFKNESGNVAAIFGTIGILFCVFIFLAGSGMFNFT